MYDQLRHDYLSCAGHKTLDTPNMDRLAAMGVRFANLGLKPVDARLFMVADERYTFMHAEGGFSPMLFDRQNDPAELVDLGRSEAHGEVMSEMYDRLARWGRRMSQRTTITDAAIEARRSGPENVGMFIGVYDESKLDTKFTQRVTGAAKPRPKSKT